MTHHKEPSLTISNGPNLQNYITKLSYQTLGLICRSFKQISTEASKQLYVSLVQSPLWRPEVLKEMFALEQVQHGATNII